MAIDWFTIAAQALNFLVLLWLMKRFLYKPILNAIDEREKLIAEKSAQAENMQAAALKQKDEYDLRKNDLDRQNSDFLKQAQDEGNSEKVRLLQEARSEADALSGKRRESLIAEERALREGLSRRIEGEVFGVTRKVLKDLADTSLEERIVRVFIKRLRGLDMSESAEGTVAVRTALDISPELKGDLEASIREIFGPQTSVGFETDPDLIGGLELGFGGQKLAWSVTDYLSSMENGFEDLLKADRR